jgi:hypothetical protein
MAMNPSEREVELARELIIRLVNRGNRPRLLPDGKVTLGGKVTVKERNWAHTHKHAVLGALVGAGHYEPGTLDRIYQIDGGGEQ